MPRVLVIEEHCATRTLIQNQFDKLLSIESANSLITAIDHYDRDSFDLVIWDTNPTLSENSEMAGNLECFAGSGRNTRTIIISDSLEPKGLCLANLDWEWLQKPVREEDLLARVKTALCGEPRGRQRGLVRAESEVASEFEGLMGLNLAMRPVIQQTMEAAGVDVPVLISGETGTGKDLVAAAIHKRSNRKEAPYLAVNMGAISPELIASELFGHERGAYTGAAEGRTGFFEQAQGGTLFLDEITTMDEKTQVSLLRVLETKTIRRVRGDRDMKVNVRVIAATNESIEDAVKKGRFREDLYYRLDVFRIHLPPLRERHGGISLLTDYFVARYNDQYKKNIRVIPPETYRLLRRYPWPGNVRELKNVVQRAVLMAKAAELSPDLLPMRIREAGGYNDEPGDTQTPIQVGMSLADVEREFMRMTLASVSGNKMKAASILGISRRALYNKLQRHGLIGCK